MGIVDWTEEILSNLADVVAGGTPPTSDKENWNGETLWATPTDITATASKYIFETSRKITKKGTKYSSELLPIGSILLCTRATIGESKIAANPITTNQGFKSLVVKSGVSNEWLFYVLQTKIEEMKSLSSGSTFLELGTKQLKEIKIETPKFTEQKAIAEALSDIDELLRILREEGTKYDKLFEGLYYSFFRELKDTTKKAIKEIGLLKTGTRKQSNNNPESKFVILDMGSVSPNGRVIESKFTDSEADLLKMGVIVIPKDDIGGGKIIGRGYCVEQANRFVLGDHVFALEVSEENPFFIRYALNSSESNREIMKLVAGSAQLGLPKSTFLNHQLPIPAREKQDEIVKNLSILEMKIELVRLEIAKYEYLKQAMMNDLLSGKVRLV